MNFLIVDDDVTICNGTARRLLNIGHDAIDRVDCACSGEAALAFMSDHAVDVLFTDIRMDGLDLIHRAKRLRPRLTCVVVTAYDHFQYAQRAIRLGVQDFLIKPCSIEEMRALTLDIVSRSLQEQRQRADRSLLALAAQGHGDLGACFSQADLPLPNGLSPQVVCWPRPVRLAWHAVEGLWHYQPKGADFMLLCAKDNRSGLVEEVLAKAAGDTGFSAGLSRATDSLSGMLCQARQALSLAWHWSVPRVVVWRSVRDCLSEPALQNLLKQAHVPQPEALREGLTALADTPGTEAPWRLAQALSALAHLWQGLCAELSLAPPAVATDPIPRGWPAVVETFVREAARIRRGMSDPALLEPIAFAKRYAREHLNEALDMATLAERLHMSYSHFSRLFHAQTGASFQDYWMDLRMLEACRLLLSGERVTAVARRLGYQSDSNFTRSFSKHFGVSPVKWRMLEQSSGHPDGDAPQLPPEKARV